MPTMGQVGQRGGRREWHQGEQETHAAIIEHRAAGRTGRGAGRPQLPAAERARGAGSMLKIVEGQAPLGWSPS